MDATLRAPSTRVPSAFARDVALGLDRAGQKSLPPRYFYDAVGSALFEAITALPEYTIARAEERVLRSHAAAIAARCDVDMVVELGSGSSRKTRVLLEQLARRRKLTYCPIEISPSALETGRALLGDMGNLSIRPIQSDYRDGLETLAREREGENARLVLFLGSSLGNFDRDASVAFLQQLRRNLRSGDLLLLGADLVKAPARLLAAYDDALGVTAAFNRNVLARVNAELGADFDLAAFVHEARWNPRDCNIEMHLVAQREHVVDIPGAACRIRFAGGESIRTEISHKYSTLELDEAAARSGFDCAMRWIDAAGLFAESLLRAR